MRYAVNWYDWGHLIEKPLSREQLLLAPILSGEAVEIRKNRPDEDSILVKEDVTPERMSTSYTRVKPARVTGKEYSNLDFPPG